MSSVWERFNEWLGRGREDDQSADEQDPFTPAGESLPEDLSELTTLQGEEDDEAREGLTPEQERRRPPTARRTSGSTRLCSISRRTNPISTRPSPDPSSSPHWPPRTTSTRSEISPTTPVTISRSTTPGPDRWPPVPTPRPSRPAIPRSTCPTSPSRCSRDEPEPEPEPAPDGWLRAPDQPQQDGPDLPDAMFTGRRHPLPGRRARPRSDRPRRTGHGTRTRRTTRRQRGQRARVPTGPGAGRGRRVGGALRRRGRSRHRLTAPRPDRRHRGRSPARPDPLSPAGGRVPPGASCGADLGR